MADDGSISGQFTAASVRVPFVADTSSLDRARDELDQWAEKFRKSFQDSIALLASDLKKLTDEAARVGATINESANRASDSTAKLQAAIMQAEQRVVEIQSQIKMGIDSQSGTNQSDSVEITQNDRMLTELAILNATVKEIEDRLEFFIQTQPSSFGGGGGG